MARLAITLHRLHGEPEFQVIAGPDVPIEEQREAIKKLARESGRVHPEIAEAQLWSSSHGCTKRFRFRLPGEPAPADESAQEPDEQEADLAAQAAGADPVPEPKPSKTKSKK